MKTVVKENILDAFNALMLKKHFDKITVEEISRNAGISKVTFYKHFSDKFDIMNYNYKKLIDDALSKSPQLTWSSLSAIIYQFLSENKQVIKNSHETIGPNSHYNFVFKYSLDLATRSIIKCKNIKQLSPVQLDECRVFVHGTVSLGMDYVNGNCSSYFPEYPAEAFVRMMPEIMHNTHPIL